MSDTPTGRIRDALAPQDPDALVTAPSLRTAVVTVVSKAAAPWTVRVRFPDGTQTDPMLCAGWYDPTVNDRVFILQQATGLLCLGAAAGSAKVVATTASLTTIAAPATPPTAPAAAPTMTVANVAAVSSRSWDPTAAAWITEDDDLRQTGLNARRAFLFYGTAIATAKGAGTIVRATLYLSRRLSQHGVDGPANVRLGTHTNATQPGSGATAHSNVATVAQLNRGEDAAVVLTSAQLAALNAGAAGLGLEPGTTGAASADYLIGLGKSALAASGQLQLVVQT